MFSFNLETENWSLAMNTMTISIREKATSFDAAFRPIEKFSEPLIRASVGLLLVPHGAQKLFGWFGGYGLEATGNFFASKLGLPSSLALIVGLIEFFGGILLALGLFTRPIALLVVGLMAGAAFRIHWAAGFFWNKGGFEYPLMWGLLALALVIRGGGAYSLDNRFAKHS
jgi:putative oxidoreductase